MDLDKNYEWMIELEGKTTPVLLAAQKGSEAVAAVEEQGENWTRATRGNEVYKTPQKEQSAFVVSVKTEAAVTAGCKAFPEGQFKRTVGEKVIFSAIAATGWKFVGWYHGDALLSESATADIAIPKCADGEEIVAMTAKFELVTA